MNRAIGLPLAAVAVLFLYGCGSAGIEDTKFARRNTPLAALQNDSDHCWKLAQKENISDADATGGKVAGYLLLGLVGYAAMSSAVEEDRKDPKNSVRRKAHDECMAKRGYRKVE
jgi:hypothetical protein